MNWKRKVLVIFGGLFFIIQFFRPAHNTSSQLSSSDISRIFVVPDSVQRILKNSCYDCHSNNTIYPWYVNIQPVGWMLANHINNGKKNLNFSEFGNYSTRKQANKLRAISQSIANGSMPLATYLLLHSDAKLDIRQKQMISSWIQNQRDSLMAKH